MTLKQEERDAIVTYRLEKAKITSIKNVSLINSKLSDSHFLLLYAFIRSYCPLPLSVRRAWGLKGSLHMRGGFLREAR